jgi:hypothetical protein
VSNPGNNEDREGATINLNRRGHKIVAVTKSTAATKPINPKLFLFP